MLRSGAAMLALAGLPSVLGDARFGLYDVRDVFVITKSDNRDQVNYAIRLDAECMPVGTEPVYAYWRILEKGPDVLEDLNWMDRKGYGIAGQWVTARAPAGSKVLISLRATRDRGIAILTRKQDGRCVAEAIATIGGAPARLQNIFVQLKGWLSVDYLELRGVRPETAQPVVERVHI